MKHLRFAALLGAVTLLGTTMGALAQTAAPAEPLAEPLAEPPKLAGGPTGKLRIIKIKNLPSALLAYQLDPASNPVPAELAPAESPKLAGDPAEKLRVIRVKNVPSALLAYQLDPVSNPLPTTLTPGVPREKVAEKPVANKGAFELPGGIKQVIPVASPNVLLIAGGSEQDFQRLQELVDILDQPLRQVEIEAQFVEVSNADLKSLGVDFSTSRGNFDAATTGFASAPVQGAFQVGFVRNNLTARLNALIADNKAKIVTAPRVTAINNLPATLGLSAKEAANGKTATMEQGYTVTPTINGDDTITILWKDVEEPKSTTIINVRDGDTIALSGVTSLRPRDPENVIVVFLTARIIRRAGEMPKP